MIASAILSAMATLVDNKIAKVVVNDTYEITTFEVKAVNGGSVGMQYLIPATIPIVTKIELKDSENKNISSNDVYVPITTDTLILQTIEIKEGL